MKSSELARLVAAGHRMYEAGLVTGAIGSMSVRLSTGEVAVTADGSRLGFLERSNVVVMNGNGLTAGASRATPCKEAGILQAVLTTRSEAGAVIRVHSPYATALSHTGRRRIENSRALLEHLGGVAFVPYYRPGTAGLAGAVSEALRSNRIAIIEEQGPVVWGRNIDDAVDLAEALEAAAKVIFLLNRNNGA